MPLEVLRRFNLRRIECFFLVAVIFGFFSLFDEVAGLLEILNNYFRLGGVRSHIVADTSDRNQVFKRVLLIQLTALVLRLRLRV